MALPRPAGVSRTSSVEMAKTMCDPIHHVPIKQVKYDERNHLSVLSQMHGSVWPRVLPYCLFNLALTMGIYALHYYEIADITFRRDGHKFVTPLVAFLIVSRASDVYKRFMQARGFLSTSYKSCRELVQHMCVLTMVDSSDGAKMWRQNVAYRTILLLRVTMATIEFKSMGRSPWDVPEMSSEERHDVKQALMLQSRTGEGHASRRWAHGDRTLDDECFRAPIILALNLRREIMRGRRDGVFEKPWRHVNEELKLLDYVTEFIKAFHGLKILITAPFPFPLVQMARTILFFFVFTLPFSLCRNTNEPIQILMIIFVTTYGFVGLEYVSMEMDDPFGDDPNDFDDLGMAQLVFEDIYIAISKLDGDESAFQLRNRVVGEEGGFGRDHLRFSTFKRQMSFRGERLGDLIAGNQAANAV